MAKRKRAQSRDVAGTKPTESTWKPDERTVRHVLSIIREQRDRCYRLAENAKVTAVAKDAPGIALRLRRSAFCAHVLAEAVADRCLPQPPPSMFSVTWNPEWKPT